MKQGNGSIDHSRISYPLSLLSPSPIEEEAVRLAESFNHSNTCTETDEKSKSNEGPLTTAEKQVHTLTRFPAKTATMIHGIQSLPS